MILQVFSQVHNNAALKIGRTLVTSNLFSFTMEKNAKEFFTEVMDLVEMAQSSYHSAVKSMKDDGVQLKKMYEDFSSSSDSLAKEMMEDVETMHQVLQLVTQLEDQSRASNLLETLRTCFNKPNTFLREFLMKTKQRQLTETRQVQINPNYTVYPFLFIVLNCYLFQILDDFLSAKKKETRSIRSTFTNYLKGGPYIVTIALLEIPLRDGNVNNHDVV